MCICLDSLGAACPPLPCHAPPDRSPQYMHFIPYLLHPPSQLPLPNTNTYTHIYIHSWSRRASRAPSHSAASPPACSPRVRASPCHVTSCHCPHTSPHPLPSDGKVITYTHTRTHTLSLSHTHTNPTRIPPPPPPTHKNRHLAILHGSGPGWGRLRRAPAPADGASPRRLQALVNTYLERKCCCWAVMFTQCVGLCVCVCARACIQHVFV
jgi:hypothetical protein